MPCVCEKCGHYLTPQGRGTSLDDVSAGDEPSKPKWAGAFGRDGHGVFAELDLDFGVSQCFRWIPPGRFLMGSSARDRDHRDDETQHEVILSRGFWLADTACTLAFWGAVWPTNPSHFHENVENPVEQVSWNDVQRFLGELNRRLPSLYARLPTEAEWEYACRAGTTTAFSFGDRITPAQVNVHSTCTVPVRSLPPNPWGLYEMHGNVWEWCADWYGKYQKDRQIDPCGPQSGIRRVLRGGSWYGGGRGSRSADRLQDEPDYRDGWIGFRLALGQVDME